MSNQYLARVPHPSLKSFLMVGVAALAAGASSSVALAQQATGNQAAGENIETVVVTGITGSR